MKWAEHIFVENKYLVWILVNEKFMHIYNKYVCMDKN